MFRSSAWALALAAALLAACSSSDDDVVIDPPPAAARKVSAIFIDAATNRPITTALDVAVRAPTGALSTVTQDADGTAQNRFTVTNGIALFEVAPSATLPVTLQVVATGEGYDPGAALVTVTGEGEFETFARMANRATPTAGTVSVARPVGTASTSGVTSSEMTVTTSQAPGSAPSLTLTVPAAATLRNLDGEPLTGALTARMSYYSAADVSALALLPGGGEAVVSNGNATQAGSFVSAGFASVEITDENGRRAATSSRAMPITITLIPAQNPLTGAVVSNGSTIPFWSYTAELGRWAQEQDAQVSRDAADRLQATGQPSHLTLFNAGWLDTRACTPATVVVSGNAANARLTALLTLNGGGFAKTYTAERDVNQFVLRGAIPQRQATVSIRLDGTEVGVTSIADACSGGQVPVNVNVPFVQPAAMNVEVLHCCIDDANVCAPVGNNGTVVVTPPGLNVVPFVKSTDQNGRALFEGLRPGVSYRIDAAAFGVPNGAIVNRTLTPGELAVRIQLPSKVCNATGATGATR